MKIAFFTDHYYPQLGGVPVVVDLFAKNLREMGHSVYIFAPKMKGYKAQDKYTFLLPSIRVFPNLPDGSRIPLPIPGKNFWKIVKLDFDLVHAHGSGPFSILGLTVAKAKKVPFIITAHSQVGSYSHYFLKGKIIKPEMMNEIFLKRLGNLCNGIVAPSFKMKELMIKSGVKREIEIIPGFVDMNKFKSSDKDFLYKKCNIPKSSPILLSVGRVGKEKNFAFLIKVLAKVLESNIKAHLVIVGPDWNESQNLLKLASKLKINNYVHLTGGIESEDMPKVYQSGTIFLFSSTTETQGIAVLEAAASSLPLIIADDSAYHGMVEEGKNGYTLPLKVEAFAQKIIELLKDPKMVKRMGQTSPKIIIKNFGAKNLMKKKVAFYNKILSDYTFAKTL